MAAAAVASCTVKRLPPLEQLLCEKEDRRKRGECCTGLQYKHFQSVLRSLRQPFQREGRHYGNLSSHKQLKEMSRPPLVGLVDDAESRNVTRHSRPRQERHYHQKEITRLPDQLSFQTRSLSTGIHGNQYATKYFALQCEGIIYVLLRGDAHTRMSSAGNRLRGPV
jgi:hypothetical protein